MFVLKISVIHKLFTADAIIIGYPILHCTYIIMIAIYRSI